MNREHVADAVTRRTGDGDGRLGKICRSLTEAQRRTIASIGGGQIFNAVRVAPRISTALRLERIGLIERGAHGLADARLTELGRAIRMQLAGDR